jgi:GT2 family glycosyltransferase
MDLSFIIVNYKSEKYLERCISLIQEKVLGVDYEIIVVNNDENPSLTFPLEKRKTSLPSLLIKRGAKGGLKIINTDGNIGYGAGCNAGAKEARGEILCFLNPDTEIASESISDLLDRFDKDDKLAVIGPRLVVETPQRGVSTLGVSTQWWCAGKEVTIWSIILNNLGYKRDKIIWESPVPIECAWVSGAALFIKKNIFDQLGGFDEKFFMYFEDIDLCKRARLAGYKVLYFPDFAVKHLGGKSFLDKKEQKSYYRKSQRRYFGKYFL